MSGTNPALNASGMTLLVVDAAGRLAEFVAVPPPFEDAGNAAPPAIWNALFEAAGLDMTAFAPIQPRVVPPVHAHERMAWEGRVAELPDHVVRVEAASFAGKPVYFVMTGPWSRSARAAPPVAPFFNVVTSTVEAMLVPGLMLAGAILARRNVRLGRGDRRGAFRVAAATFAVMMAAWVFRPHALPPSADVDRMFDAIASALLNGGILWLTYLGLEPYVRRHSPDSLIGWTRLVAGNWQDPRVGTDVMIGVSAGLAMTVFYGVHNVIPPLFGRAEPIPISMDATLLMGTREVLAHLFGRIAAGMQGAMLCVVGYVALRIGLKHAWLAAIAAIVLFTPVAINGMFPPGTPVLDLILGAAIISVFVAVIVRFGLLATMAALTTHFVLLRAPLTLDVWSWRAGAALWYFAIVAVGGFGSVYLARRGRTTAASRPAYQVQGL